MKAHAQKPDFVFHRNGPVHLNRRGSQFSRLLAVEECASAGRLWIDLVPRYSARVVASLSNRLFRLHFPSHASPFRTASTCCTDNLLQVPAEQLQTVIHSIHRNDLPDTHSATRHNTGKGTRIVIDQEQD